MSDSTGVAASGRLLSLDAFRGATIAAMLLVNNPGDWGHVYAPLLHAPWHGWTVTDWIFPFFLFICGMAMPISLGRRQALGTEPLGLCVGLIRRGLVILLIGLLLNAIPAFDWQALRWPGVLQRIGLCIILCAPAAVWLAWKGQALVGAGLLVVYSLLMLMVPVPGDDGVVRTGSLLAGQDTGSWIDRALMGGHLWAKSRTWDPEGLLSTLPAAATLLAGVLAGHWMAHTKEPGRRCMGLVVAGLLALWAGEVLDVLNMPINKSLWTPAYVASTGGWALLIFAAFHWLLDAQADAASRKHWRIVAQPMVDFGMNALFLFVLGGLVAKALAFTQVGGLSLKAHLVAALHLTGLPPVQVSLLFALGFVLVFHAIAVFMARRQWFIKV
jgi:predicted acyltransferase